MYINILYPNLYKSQDTALLQYSIIKITNFRLTTMILMKALFHLEQRSATKRNK